MGAVINLSADKKIVKVNNHIYQPKHEILSKDESEAILKKFNVRTNQLPYIMASDKGLEELDIRPGDIIKITRKSPTAGESVYYRYVVQG